MPKEIKDILDQVIDNVYDDSPTPGQKLRDKYKVRDDRLAAQRSTMPIPPEVLMIMKNNGIDVLPMTEMKENPRNTLGITDMDEKKEKLDLEMERDKSLSRRPMMRQKRSIKSGDA